MPEYIEKARVAVSVGIPGEQPVKGLFYLSPRSPIHEGPESILELLNSTLRVIPIVMNDNDTVLLLSRQSVEWVLPGVDVESKYVLAPPVLVTREEDVHITFNDSRTVRGVLQMELPANMNRVSDFLNAPGDFFPLRTKHGIMLVNKDRVRQIRVLAPSPPPIYTVDEI